MDNLATIIIVSTVSPSVLALLTWWLRRSDKREDWARQDAVAARVEQVQAALKEVGDTTAAKVAAVQTALADSDKSTNSKLDSIQKTGDATKTLVDGQMTASIEAELAATERELMLLRQVATLHMASGQAVTGEAKNTIELTEVKIGKLRDVLADRYRNDYIAKAQLEHHNPDPEPEQP